MFWKSSNAQNSTSSNVLPKRRIVERTFGWFNWYRRLSKDYEHNPKTSEAMIHFLASNLILKRLATL